VTLALGLQVALGLGALLLALAFGFNLGQLVGERRLNEASDRMLREHRESLSALLRTVSGIREGLEERLGGEKVLEVRKGSRPGETVERGRCE